MRNSYRDRRDETGSNRSWKSSQFSNIVERRLERAAMTEEESKGERKNETSISVVPKRGCPKSVRIAFAFGTLFWIKKKKTVPLLV